MSPVLVCVCPCDCRIEACLNEQIYSHAQLVRQEEHSKAGREVRTLGEQFWVLEVEGTVKEQKKKTSAETIFFAVYPANPHAAVVMVTMVK